MHQSHACSRGPTPNAPYLKHEWGISDSPAACGSAVLKTQTTDLRGPWARAIGSAPVYRAGSERLDRCLHPEKRTQLVIETQNSKRFDKR